MRFAALARQLPVRVATGAFILNSGLGKWSADDEAAARVHGMAVGTYPFLGGMKATDFTKLLAASEIALGAALLLPVVPASVAGAALTSFSGGLLGLYLKTPGLRQEGSLRPTQQGIPIAKDVWMLGIGLGLIADAATAGRSAP